MSAATITDFIGKPKITNSNKSFVPNASKVTYVAVNGQDYKLKPGTTQNIVNPDDGWLIKNQIT